MDYDNVSKTDLLIRCAELQPTMPAKLKMIDLFAGTGAFTSAFESTGKVECVFANDMVEVSFHFIQKGAVLNL